MDFITIEGEEVFIIPNKVCFVSPFIYKRRFHKKIYCTVIVMIDGTYVCVQEDYSEVRAKMRFVSGEMGIYKEDVEQLQRKIRSMARALAIERSKNKKN